MISKLKETGFFHVFGSNVINKIISFGSGIFLVRLLSKGDYGIYIYASNLITMFLLLNGLGTTTGMIQFGSENYKDNIRISEAYFKYGFRIGGIFNIILTIAIIAYTFLFNLPIEGADYILLIMSGVPIVAYIFETIQVYLRVAIRNKEFAYLNTANTLMIFICSAAGALLFQIYGVVIFMYAAYLAAIVIGLKLSKIISQVYKTHYTLSSKEKNIFMKFSLITIFNNAIAQLLYTMDIFMIGVFIGNVDIIASYKTATLIPFALNFIPSSIITYMYPYFARHNNDKLWIEKKYFQILKYLGVFNAFLSIILFLFAPLIIKLIFGEEYMDSLNAFRILAIGYFFAGTFRIVTGNIIVMIKKVKFNLYLSIITGVLNIILDVILIRHYGAVGASIAALSIFIFTSIVSTIYLIKWLREKT